jgi:hypothetical protein
MNRSRDRNEGPGSLPRGGEQRGERSGTDERSCTGLLSSSGMGATGAGRGRWRGA